MSTPTEDAVTAGLLDALDRAVRILARRDLTDPAVRPALRALACNHDLYVILRLAQMAAEDLPEPRSHDAPVPDPIG